MKLSITNSSSRPKKLRIKIEKIMCYEIIKDLFFPFVLSAFLAYIAYQQLITNKNKLKLDLYNKRFEIYEDTLKLYHELDEENGSTKETMRKFISSKEASKFLFSNDPSIYNLLNEIHNESFKINACKKNSNNKTTNDELYERMREASKIINNNIPILHEKLETYLSFK